ncbi:MAG: DUF3501 family protein [Gammaproteobacteria bacterium]
MSKLTREDLMSLEQYAENRAGFRDKVIAHKKNRQLSITPHATLYFEDHLTMQYQIQEMLRVERIFEAAGIQEELDAYNPLIPDGSNWKATFMIEYDDVEERKQALAKLVGVEDKVWMQVEGFDRVWAITDEDLERETEEKTSSVHFLRFELGPDMVAAVKNGSAIHAGIDHDNLRQSVEPVPQNVRDSLAGDLQ